MKKIISTLLACACLYSFAACNASVPDQSAASSEKTTAETENNTELSDTAVENSENDEKGPINSSLKEIRFKILNEYCDSTVSLYDKKYTLKDQEKNSPNGITDFSCIFWLGNWIVDGEIQYSMDRCIYLIEFDMNSDSYKNLKIGDEIKLYISDEREQTVHVAAINGQYVLGLTGEKDVDSKDKVLEENMPDYTIGNLQEIYKTFTEFT